MFFPVSALKIAPNADPSFRLINHRLAIPDMRFSEEWLHSYKKNRTRAADKSAGGSSVKSGKGSAWLAAAIEISVHAKALAALVKKPDLLKGKKEHYDQVRIFDHFHRHNRVIYDHLYAVPNGGFRLKATAAAIEAEGAKRGVPDMSLEIPAGIYHGMRVEQKYGKNMPSEYQLTWMRRLKAQGYYVLLSFSPEETISVMEQYAVLKAGEVMPAHENDGFWSE
ncbi:PDDEXK family nuclease [Pantoea brenneri]|nr:VRR-NUC domain-containing protein [Pantoea brenneri]